MNESVRMPTHEGVREAARKIAEILPPTPLLPVEIGGVQCWVKCENLQPIGSFKIRGAWNRLASLSEEQRTQGIVAVSSGNHAQGVARAAKRLGISATIVMPHDAPQVKLDATRAHGAEVVIYRRPEEDRDAIAAKLIAESGGTLVHAFGDRWVIEGQGSIGIELAQQLGRQPSRIAAPCGGGGLVAGLSLACPDAAIVPVEPEGWDQVGQSLRAGEIVLQGPNPPRTICDALQPLATKQINFDVLFGRSDPGVAVSDEEVLAAQRFAFEHLRLVVEPGGAAALAAAIAGKVPLDEHTVIILSGGNVDPKAFAQTIAGS